MGSKTGIIAKDVTPIRDNVFVEELDNGLHMSKGGIIRLDDNMKDHGIHPRWAKVYAIGPDVTEVSVGEWVLVSHGRWTLGIDLIKPQGTVRVWRIEWPEAVLLVSSDDPRENLPYLAT